MHGAFAGGRSSLWPTGRPTARRSMSPIGKIAGSPRSGWAARPTSSAAGPWCTGLKPGKQTVRVDSWIRLTAVSSSPRTAA